ncbi:MAG: MEDS domain-containing protein, partial [Spirochaetia bacterium]
MGAKKLAPRWISDIQPGDHLCWIFDAAEDQFAILAEFISSGVERNEKTLLLADIQRLAVLYASLSSLAVPVVELSRKGDLVCRPAETTMLRGQTSSWLPAILKDETSRALVGGHSGLRVAWEVGLPPARQASRQRLAAAESEAHAALSQIRCSLLCQYDRRAFPAKLLQEVTALHPLVLTGPDVPGTFARGLIDQSVDGIALVDENSVIIEWNAAMAAITGVPRQAVLHKHVRELSRMMSMDPPLLMETVERMTKGAANFRVALVPEWLRKPFEVRLLHATARERVVQVKLFPVRLSGKVVVGALFEDVTEKKRTERLLEDSRKELRNLALHLLAAREEERRSVAIDIHDELGQSLTALKMDILQ